MNNSPLDGHSKAGVIGGMVLTLLSTVNSADIWKTIVMAAIGSAVSFTVSLLLKHITRRKGR